jgi:TolB-like protein/Tfp pilus assembly protein PilF
LNSRNFFTELKRRNVLRAGVLYAGSVWALAQGISQLGPTVGAPEWATRWFLAAAAIGFPLWIAFAWYYEFTPTGLKRESEIAPENSMARSTGRKLDKWIIAVLALAVVLLLTNQFVLRNKADQLASTPEKSLAVLAFTNLSEDKSNESFADSVSEELSNALGKVPGLRVTARTSAFHFKGKDTPIPEIARQLGVAYVVEGSVRRSADKVRIAAQLIKAADGFQVWSDDFNRDLKDVFAVQEEIAGVIAQNLELKLGIKKDRRAPNPEAYQLYLEAVRLWGLRDPASLARAEQLLQRAIALQPDFARAYAAMGFVLSIRSAETCLDPIVGEGRSLNEQALQWADRALALDPDLAEGYAAKGNVLDNLGRWTECKQIYRRSVELDPNFATAHQWYARALSQEGYLGEAMVEMKRAVELDPLAPRILDNYANYLIASGNYPEALEILDRALMIQPSSLQAQNFRGWALMATGRTEEARTIFQALSKMPDRPEWNVAQLAQALLATGHRTEAEALLQNAPGENFYRGLLLCALGRGEEGIQLLKPTISIQRDIILWLFQEIMPRQSPEFQHKLAEWDMAEPWQRAEAWRANHSPRQKVSVLP